ncbi:MAG: DUF1571 domain-containing protein [Planctomycetales bacterium]|nr:DUF1571 domain-containing protein [Planctomycetales bacterium]
MRRSFILLTILLAALTAISLIAPTSLRPRGSESQSSLSGAISVTAPLPPSSSSSKSTADDDAAEQPTMAELIALAQEMLAHMQSNIRDYRGTLVKHERIKGKLAEETRMEFKIRNPLASRDTGLAAYLKFSEPRSARGREVIWVDGRDDNQLIAHEGGFLNLLRVQLAPNSSLAMLGNKYPITEIGLLRLAEKLIEKIDRDVDLSQCLIETREQQFVGDRPCRLIQVTQPKSVPGADFYIAQVFLDTQRQIPLRYASFLWPERPGEPPPLEEEYTYLDVELNVGLSDSDFDPDNPSYNYP